MKLYILPLFMVIGITLNSHAMEHKNSMEITSENCFDLLPDETLLGIFSQIVPICENQKEAFTTIITAQSIEKRCFSLINSDTGIKLLNKQMISKFGTSLDLYPFFNYTQGNKQELKFAKTVFYYAALHHNELHTTFKEEELPWMQFPNNAYCTALSKSCHTVLQQEEFVPFAQKVAADFNTFKDKQQPEVVVSTYCRSWNPHSITAELLYLCDTFDTALKEALKNKLLSNRLRNYHIGESGKVKKIFAQPFIWQPSYFKIPEVFQENKDSIQDTYLEMSKKSYKFN